LTVEDLEISKDKKIEQITPPDSVVVTVTLPKKFTEEEENTETSVTEPALVSDDKEE
jgi:hypothetical protein